MPDTLPTDRVSGLAGGIHLPNLAGSLNNLSNHQSEAGDRAAALATSTEAVQHYRALAKACAKPA